MKDKQILLVTYTGGEREIIKDRKWVDRIVDDMELGKSFIRINEHIWISATDIQNVRFNVEPRL